MIGTSRGRSLSPRKQVGAGKDEGKKSGAPTINGKNYEKNYEIVHTRSNADSNADNMQMKSTKNHRSNIKLPLTQSTGYTRDSFNNRFRAHHSINSAVRLTNWSGNVISTISNRPPNFPTSSTIRSTSNARIKMPPIAKSAFNVSEKANSFKSNAQNNRNTSTAQVAKYHQLDEVTKGKQNSYITPFQYTSQNDNYDEFYDGADTNGPSEEEDAKSNMTYKIR